MSQTAYESEVQINSISFKSDAVVPFTFIPINLRRLKELSVVPKATKKRRAAIHRRYGRQTSLLKVVMKKAIKTPPPPVNTPPKKPASKAVREVKQRLRNEIAALKQSIAEKEELLLTLDQAPTSANNSPEQKNPPTSAQIATNLQTLINNETGGIAQDEAALKQRTVGLQLLLDLANSS